MTNPQPVLLVVDDNRDNAALLARRLERHDFKVITTNSGIHALQSLEQQDFDLVLLDILMREMDGIETLSRIRDKYTLLELPVIMATALTDSQDVVGALNAGANDYVIKPLDIDVVVARIQNQLKLTKKASPENLKN